MNGKLVTYQPVRDETIISNFQLNKGTVRLICTNALLWYGAVNFTRYWFVVHTF